MIPLKTDNRFRKIPVITVLLIAANVIVFCYQLFGDTGFQATVYQMGIIPREFRFLRTAAVPGRIPFFFTPITAMFLHADIFHLLSNMLFLWIFGKDMEAGLGHLFYPVFYLVCGVAASAVHILLNLTSTMPLIGASGAIAGILGAYFIRYPRTRVYTLIFLFFFIRVVPIPAFIVLGYWFLIQVIEGLAVQPGMGGVAWFAHIGGFLFGLIWMLLMRKKRRVIRMYV